MFLNTLFHDPLYYLTVIAVVVFSVCFHEYCHARAALWEGDDTAKNAGFLAINPMRQMGKSALVILLLIGITWGVTPTNPQHFRHTRYGQAIVALAGPVGNGLLMIAASFMVLLIGLLPLPKFLLDPFLSVFEVAALLNATLFLINILPLPPLDGFTVLSSLYPPALAWRQKMAGWGILALFVLFGVFGKWFEALAMAMVTFWLLLFGLVLRVFIP